MAEYVDVLREVAGIVNSLAGHGKEAFIWWLAVDFAGKIIQPVATLAGWVLCVLFLTRTAGRVAMAVRFSDEYVFHLRDMVRPDRTGSEYINEIDKAELRKMSAVMQALLMEKKAGGGDVRATG